MEGFVRFTFVSLIAVSFACGQQTLTVSATRSTNVQPDVAQIIVDVTAPQNDGLDDVVSALAGSGVVASNLTSLYSTQSGGPASPTLDWTFRLTVPLAKLKDTIAALTAVESSLAQKQSAISLNLSGVNLLSSSVQQGSNAACPVADLISDARAQAQKISSATGSSLGGISAISDASTPGVASVVVQSFAYFLLASPRLPAPPTCTIVVQFNLVAPQ